ncbi:MAG: MBL fold metallo-hydrolase [Deltaproteobacteria bacterium]|nr:MBL fold metallo-hydrolase [Deltaproteobacteria bacterium]
MRSLFVLFLIACSGVRYQGPPSDHFDGERFHNMGDVAEVSFYDLVKWQATRTQGHWPDFVTDPPATKPRERVGEGELVVTWVGHATMLVQLDGKNILTDPVWSDTVGPLAGVGPKRVRAPGVRFEDLPPIDAIVISHSHFDHMDLPSLARLSAAFAPRVYAGLGNKRLLEEAGVKNVSELDWWEADNATGIEVTAVPVQHFSRRGLDDAMRSLWAGYVFSGARGRVYFGGDTGFGPHFSAVREKLGPMRAALLPIGAYLPRWFMYRQHISPKEAIAAAKILGADTAIAMHFDTFNLADEAFEQAPRELRYALETTRDAQRFWIPTPGAALVVP